MKTTSFRRQFILAVVALAMAGVVPAQAARISKHQAYRSAVFQTASTAKIAVGTNRSATLLDVKVGDQVSIAYDQENGALVAHHISDGVPPKPRTASANPLPVTHVAHHSATAHVYFHVRGVVQSVDTQSGTVTIAYRARV
jgi:Cu/Ag efflux protein CusF